MTFLDLSVPPCRGTQDGHTCAWIVSPEPSLASSLIPLLKTEAPSWEIEARQQSLPVTGVPPDLDAGGAAVVCFLDMCADPARALASVESLSQPPLLVPVVAVLQKSDPELALGAIRAGACGCLLRPFDAEQLKPVLMRIQILLQQRKPEPSGRLICVAPAMGSCGASVLAVNLAAQAKRAGVERILLADLDTVAGTIGFRLKLKSVHSFADALRHATQLDEDLWRGLVVPGREFDTLLAPENTFDCEPDPAALTAVIAYARRSYDLVIADTGGLRGALGIELARLCDDLVFVLTPAPAAIYSAKRWLAHLSASGVGRSKVHIVMNRYSRLLGLSPEDAEAALAMKISCVLPEDPLPIHAALLEGKPAAASCPFGRKAAVLCETLLRSGVPARRPQPRKRLLSLFTRGG